MLSPDGERNGEATQTPRDLVRLDFVHRWCTGRLTRHYRAGELT